MVVRLSTQRHYLDMKKNYLRDLLMFSLTNIVLFFLLSRAAEATPPSKLFPAICSAMFAFLLIVMERLRQRIDRLETHRPATPAQNV
jgi:hypothetical protein